MKSECVSVEYLHSLWKAFCIIFFHKKNLGRDLIILGVLVIFLALLLINNSYGFFGNKLVFNKFNEQPFNGYAIESQIYIDAPFEEDVEVIDSHPEEVNKQSIPIEGSKKATTKIISPRPKAVIMPPVSKRVNNAPRPISYKRNADGLRVCAKRGDHPSKSDTKKKKHMDMECCLDPDEYPNPNCHYPTSKYGKYL